MNFDRREFYDVVPYESSPVADAHPTSLAVLAKWFGMSPAPPETARVLELGCGSGANLIPMAWYLPNARFVGIDRARGSLAIGQGLLERLGLTNIELRCADFVDLIPEALGTFDYIVIHGVWSWVAAPVQEQLLYLCGECLTPQGVAYLSYNTLPGWRTRGILRDFFRYSTRMIPEPEVRLAATRGLLTQLLPALSHDESLMSRYLTHEVEELLHAHPGYLFHEYLAEHNTPILFADFIERAAAHGLNYLAEAELHTMFHSTLPLGAIAVVDHLETLVEQEQYMDFLRYRYFRKTLLCRSDVSLNRDLDLNRIREFSLTADLLPVLGADLTKSITEDFAAPDGVRFTVTHPLTKAALAHLAEVYPDAVPYQELEDIAIHDVARAGAIGWNSAQLIEELFSLYAHHALRLTLKPEKIYAAIPERPQAHSLARAQALAQFTHLTTIRHTTLEIDPLSGQLIQLMDGTRTLEELAADLMIYLAHHTARAIVRGGIPEIPTDTQFLAGCRHLVELFARHGLLNSLQE